MEHHGNSKGTREPRETKGRHNKLRQGSKHGNYNILVCVFTCLVDHDASTQSSLNEVRQAHRDEAKLHLEFHQRDFADGTRSLLKLPADMDSKSVQEVIILAVQSVVGMFGKRSGPHDGPGLDHVGWHPPHRFGQFSTWLLVCALVVLGFIEYLATLLLKFVRALAPIELMEDGDGCASSLSFLTQYTRLSPLVPCTETVH